MALFHTRQTNSSILVQPLSLPPSYNVGHVYTLFVQTFNIVLGGGGRKQRILKRIRVLFLKFRFKNTGINAITQVSQGILSTIVALLAEILANKFCPSAVVPALQSIWFYYTNDYIWVVAWSQYV